mmetsp:Transcript_9629/g.18773  ORF Transcript_9629/g.18773 Transcript_9629/m.18773 type:complete len:462 (-) Transcript_9629:22-1407(-)
MKSDTFALTAVKARSSSLPKISPSSKNLHLDLSRAMQDYSIDKASLSTKASGSRYRLILKNIEEEAAVEVRQVLTSRPERASKFIQRLERTTGFKDELALRRIVIEKKAKKLNKLRHIRKVKEQKLAELRGFEEAFKRENFIETDEEKRITQQAKAYFKLNRKIEMQEMMKAVYEHMLKTRKDRLVVKQDKITDLKTRLAEAHGHVNGVQNELEVYRTSALQIEQDLGVASSAQGKEALVRIAETEQLLFDYKTKALTEELFQVEHENIQNQKMTARKLRLRQKIDSEVLGIAKYKLYSHKVEKTNIAVADMEQQLATLCKVTSAETVEQMINRFEQLKIVEENLEVMRTQQELMIIKLKEELDQLQIAKPQTEVGQEIEQVDTGLLRMQASRVAKLQHDKTRVEKLIATSLIFFSALAKKVSKATEVSLESDFKVANQLILIDQLASHLASVEDNCKFIL